MSRNFEDLSWRMRPSIRCNVGLVTQPVAPKVLKSGSMDWFIVALLCIVCFVVGGSIGALHMKWKTDLYIRQLEEKLQCRSYP